MEAERRIRRKSCRARGEARPQFIAIAAALFGLVRACAARVAASPYIYCFSEASIQLAKLDQEAEVLGYGFKVVLVIWSAVCSNICFRRHVEKIHLFEFARLMRNTVRDRG